MKKLLYGIICSVTTLSIVTAPPSSPGSAAQAAGARAADDTPHQEIPVALPPGRLVRAHSCPTDLSRLARELHTPRTVSTLIAQEETAFPQPPELNSECATSDPRRVRNTLLATAGVLAAGGGAALCSLRAYHEAFPPDTLTIRGLSDVTSTINYAKAAGYTALAAVIVSGGAMVMRKFHSWAFGGYEQKITRIVQQHRTNMDLFKQELRQMLTGAARTQGGDVAHLQTTLEHFEQASHDHYDRLTHDIRAIIEQLEQFAQGDARLQEQFSQIKPLIERLKASGSVLARAAARTVDTHAPVGCFGRTRR